DHELADSAGTVDLPARRAGGEALVVVVVSGEDDVRPRGVEVLPEGCGDRIVPVETGREPRVVPVGERAPGPMRREAATKPPLLGRARPAASDRGAVGVQRDEMPRADVEGVVPLPGRTGRLPEVLEVAGRVRRPVLVVAGGGVGDRLHATPGRCVGDAEGRVR